MSQNRLPEIKDPLAQIANLAINPQIIPEEHVKMEIKNVVEEIPEEPVNSEMVFGKPGVSKDKMVNESLPVPEEGNAVKKGQGKRGKDKKKRKKKVMSEAQLASLAKGRAASLAKRQAKAQAKSEPKSAPIPIIAPPVKAQALDYSTFSNYMDMYEEKKKKKYSTSTQPHPNKVINERHRPTPPRSAPRIQPKQAPSMMNWNGNISAYQSHKKTGKSRWNYGI